MDKETKNDVAAVVGDVSSAGQETVQQEATENEAPKALTQADVDRQISKLREKWEADQAEKVKTAVAEVYAKAEAEAKMTEKERLEADLKDRMEEVEKREKKLADMELLASIKADLSTQGLPLEFADALLPLQEEEAIKTAIANIKSSYDKSVQEAVNAKLKQDPPRSQTREYGATGAGLGLGEFAQKNRIIK